MPYDYRLFRRLYLKSFPGASGDEMRTSFRQFVALHQSGGGGGLEFILDPKKRTEILDQLGLCLKNQLKGYGLTGALGWAGHVWNQRYEVQGKKEYIQTIAISKLILWHPVRGKGEREAAGTKTDQRREAVKWAIRNGRGKSGYTQTHPFCADDWNEIQQRNADDSVYLNEEGKPVYIMKSTEEIYVVPTHFVLDTKKIQELKTDISHLVAEMDKNRHSKDRQLFLQLSSQYKETMARLSATIKRTNRKSTKFLILAGQGRVQAVIEAIRELKINPDTFFIKCYAGSVPVEGCNILLDIHNDYIEEKLFDDERHYVYDQKKWKPMEVKPVAYSCASVPNERDIECWTRYSREQRKSLCNIRGHVLGYNPCDNIRDDRK